MPNMVNENDAALYAVYMIQEKRFTKSCVKRQIRKNERNVNGVLWYRHANGGHLSYKKINVGMVIEYWWPYKGKDDDGQEGNGRFRKAKVIKAEVVKHGGNTEEERGLKQSLLKNVHAPKGRDSKLTYVPALFNEVGWENVFHQCLLDVVLPNSTNKEVSDDIKKIHDEAESLKAEKIEICAKITDKKRNFNRAIAQANSLGVTWS